MTAFITTIAIAYYLLVFTVALGVVTDNRNPAKTLAYLLALILLPIIGLVVYVLFGQNLRKRKLFSRRSISNNAQIKAWEEGRMNQFQDSMEEAKAMLHEKVKVVNLLLSGDRAVVTQNNELEVMHECGEIFPRMFEDMRQARHHLHIEFYIVDDDEVGNEFKQILIDKSREGVEVRMIVDDVGSRKLPRRFFRELRSAGVEVHVSLPVFFPYLTGKANFRNHRKIVVIDGKTGYLGGINIADRYTNRNKALRYWRDTQLRIAGEAVKSLQIHFMQMWKFSSGKTLPINTLYFPEVKVSENHLMQITASGPDDDWPSIMQAMLMAINTAEDYIYITTPYFIPNDEIVTALQIAALGGVDVQVLVPKKGDSPLTQAASMGYIRQMLEAGVKVHRYTKGFIHAKTIVIDDTVSTIGTTNMDNRSFNLNFEINAFVYDRSVAAGLREQFRLDCQHSEQITLKRWKKRGKLKKLTESFARIFAPLL
jgi:cardiolipin synthase